MPKLWAKGCSAAHQYACEQLSTAGFSILQAPDKTVDGVLLDVPSFRDTDPADIAWEELPENAIVIGGNLAKHVPDRFRSIDLLRDPEFTAQNADITARCALRLAAGHLKQTYRRLPVLILGWGRIGKCLARLLRGVDTEVCVFARKPADRAILKGLGYDVIAEADLASALSRFSLVFNTAPSLLLSREMTARCPDCLLIDLASQPGMQGDDVLWARGLPGKMAPESSGKLIAETILRLWKENGF